MLRNERINNMADRLANEEMSKLEREKLWGDLYYICQGELRKLAIGSYNKYGEYLKMEEENFYSIADASFIKAIRGTTESKCLRGDTIATPYKKEFGSFLPRVKFYFGQQIAQAIRYYNKNAMKTMRVAISGDSAIRDKNALETDNTIFNSISSNIDIEEDYLNDLAYKAIINYYNEFASKRKNKNHARIIRILAEHPNCTHETLRHIYIAYYGIEVKKDAFRAMIRRARIAFKEGLINNGLYK